MSEHSSDMNSEIVRQIQSGNSVTVYSEAFSDSGKSESNPGNSIMTNAEEIVGEIMEGERRKVVVITKPTDHPLPLPS